MSVIWLVFFFLLGACQFGVGTSKDCYELNTHYMNNLTIYTKNDVNSQEECSDHCRINSICSHWSWSKSYWSSNTCELKYVAPGTPPKAASETDHRFTSGERFCGSLVPSVCPKMTVGDTWGGIKKKISHSLTLEKCISDCEESYPGKIYIRRSAASKDDEAGECECEMSNTTWFTKDDNYKSCTLPSRGSPKSVQIEGSIRVMAGQESSYFCNPEGGYPAPSIHFTASDTTTYTRPLINKIHINPIPRQKQLNFFCVVSNGMGQVNGSKLVIVEWNEIKQIFGNLSPSRRSNETYSCDVDANPSPKVTWAAIDSNGIAVPFQEEYNNVTLKLEAVHSNITLTCNASIDGNPALDTYKIISILVQWNEIHNISGNLFPTSGSNETYNCNVDANPSPKITWTAIDRNGLGVPVEVEDNITTLKLEAVHSNITLTCHSKIDGNSALDTFKKISVIVERNKIFNISGNLFPMPGSKETYSCNVDANPSPKITWTAIGSNGTDIPFQSKHKDITLEIEAWHSNITLTCHSSIDGNSALNTSDQLFITVQVSDKKSLPFDLLLGTVIGILSLLFIAVISSFAVKKWRRDDVPYTSLINSTSNNPLHSHMVLKKSRDLDRHLQKDIKDKAMAKAAFIALDDFGSTEVTEVILN